MIAVPSKVSELWKRIVTPSVTSWSSASTSFVSRLIYDARAVPFVEPERKPLQVSEEVVPEVGEDPLVGPAGEVRLRRAREQAGQACRDHQRDEHREQRDITAANAVVDRELGEVRRTSAVSVARRSETTASVVRSR